MTMEYRRPYQQTQSGGSDLGWILFCAIVAASLCLAGLPWMVIGCVMQRTLTRWLPWRVSFLVWLILLFVSAFTLYHTYQYGGLEALFHRELTDYIIAAKHYQSDLASYPLRRLWTDTWPVWLHTWQSIGIAGFVSELYTATRTNTTRTLQQQERRRQRRAQRSQRRARKRTSQPARIPDEVGGMMVIGIPIHDDHEEA